DVGPGEGAIPCTFADAGVRPNVPAGLHTQVSFVEFPVMANGFAVVKILFTPLPSGLNVNKFALYEDTSGNGSFSSKVTVLPCDPVSGLPQSGDSCIFNRSSLPKGGAEIDLHVTGSPFDGSYAG